jgi:hypothetical protein
MQPNERLPLHEASLMRIKSKKTAFHIIFGAPGDLTFTRL